MEHLIEATVTDMNYHSILDKLELAENLRAIYTKLSQTNNSNQYFPRTSAMNRSLFEANTIEIKRLAIDLLPMMQLPVTPKRSFVNQHKLATLTPTAKTKRFGSPNIGKMKTAQTATFEKSSDILFAPDVSFISKRKLAFVNEKEGKPKLKRRTKTCKIETCSTNAIGKSGLCKKHGGGKRCIVEGCTKASQGKAGKCVTHGGGKRCIHPECTKLSRGRSNYCIPHGGGLRCKVTDCSKLAQGGTKFCIRHGGGRRCQFTESFKLSEESNPVIVHCKKSAVANTNFCVNHGGGRRCSYPECTKSAIGRTSFCVRHGGGKRCKVSECSKSAVGKTVFCISHGGSR